ncbi:MAG: DUF4388 domain-containing protein, partial [Lentisphaerota bacterium]
IVMVAGAYWWLKERKTMAARARKSVATAASSAGLDAESKLSAATLTAAADFSGALTSMSMSVLSQMLNSEMATGVLTVKDKDHADLGTLTFVNGEIVDANSLGKRGTEAVHMLIRQKQGSFLFVRKARLETKKTVHQNTVSLLLEAARMIDEKNPSTPGLRIG